MSLCSAPLPIVAPIFGLADSDTAWLRPASPRRPTPSKQLSLQQAKSDALLAKRINPNVSCESSHRNDLLTSVAIPEEDSAI